jgi:hypothetical protein
VRFPRFRDAPISVRLAHVVLVVALGVVVMGVVRLHGV